MLKTANETSSNPHESTLHLMELLHDIDQLQNDESGLSIFYPTDKAINNILFVGLNYPVKNPSEKEILATRPSAQYMYDLIRKESDKWESQ